LVAFVAMTVAVSAAEMTPTAPDKMTSPAARAKMKKCEARAAAENVRMDQRAKFIMDCMTAK
jgi:hypothetical protein